MAHHTFAQRTELTLPMIVVSSFLLLRSKREKILSCQQPISLKPNPV